jgi:hypothetical protein
VYPITPNQAVLQFSQELSLALRHLLIYCAWAVFGALAAMGACYCCGYAAREVWGKNNPVQRRPERPSAQDAVSREAELGIKQIEDYLWATCSNRGEPPHDGRASDPGTGTASS